VRALWASDRRPRRSCRNSDCAGCATWPRSTKRRSRRTWEWRWPRRSSPTPTAGQARSHDRSGTEVGRTRPDVRRIVERPRAVLEAAKSQAAVVARALRGQGRVARTITVIVRFDDLTSVSRSQTLSFGIDDEVAILAIAEALLQSIDLANSFASWRSMRRRSSNVTTTVCS